jgi:hypothetical protein
MTDLTFMLKELKYQILVVAMMLAEEIGKLYIQQRNVGT